MRERETEYQNNSAEVGGMVRFGTVTAVDNDKRIARVKFPDLLDSNGQPLVSDWIPVLINRDFIPDYDTEPQRTEFEQGGSGYPAFENHKHDLIIKPYMPKVNDQVVCLFEPIRNGRGVLLGGVKAWQ